MTVTVFRHCFIEPNLNWLDQKTNETITLFTRHIHYQWLDTSHKVLASLNYILLITKY